MTSSMPPHAASRPSSRSLVALAATACLAALATLGCDSSSPGIPVGQAPSLQLACESLAGSVPAGGAVTLTFSLTDDGRPLAGRTLSFAATAGAVSPASARTNISGQVRVTFLAPSQAGTAVVSATQADVPGTQAISASCVIEVTGSQDVLATVTLLSPETLAGLSLTLDYDPLDVSLDSAILVGPLTGTDCVSDSRFETGRVELQAGCPTARDAGSLEVARFTFSATSGVQQTASDFVVDCEAVDVTGTSIGAACLVQVTEI